MFSWLFIAESALLLLPLILMHLNNNRSPKMLFVCAVFILIGAAMWRMNYSLVAYNQAMVTTISQQQANC